MTSAQEILDCPMGHNDAGAATVREYLITLLETLWQEGEGFSGKRPFGNSGWQYELYDALAAAGLSHGATADEDGFYEFTRDQGYQGYDLIRRAIRGLS